MYPSDTRDNDTNPNPRGTNQDQDSGDDPLEEAALALQASAEAAAGGAAGSHALHGGARPHATASALVTRVNAATETVSRRLPPWSVLLPANPYEARTAGVLLLSACSFCARTGRWEVSLSESDLLRTSLRAFHGDARATAA